MSLATAVQHVDLKTDTYCSGCNALIAEMVAHLREGERAMVGSGGTP